MESRFSLQQMALRAFDLSERGVRAGAQEQRRRVDRWRGRLWMICQIACTAGLAWWVCLRLLHHPIPAFGPVAATVTLGFSFGQRLSRAVEIAVGVALGVFFGDMFVRFFGVGTIQLVLVCFVAMSVATWVGARNLMVIQAGLQSIMVMTLLPDPGQGLNRWVDALVGVSLALVVTTIAPTSTVSKPRLLAAGVLTEAAATLDAVREALIARDPQAAEEVFQRARNSEKALSELDTAAKEGLAVVRYSPFFRGRRDQMQNVEALTDPLDRMLRNLRVLARRSAIALWRDEEIPVAYLDLAAEVAEELRLCAAELQARRIPESVRPRLVALGETSSHLPIVTTLSAIVLLAQLRSILVDALQLTGLDPADAREAIPEME